MDPCAVRTGLKFNKGELREGESSRRGDDNVAGLRFSSVPHDPYSV